MVVGVPTVEAPSLVKIGPRSIGQQHTPLAGLVGLLVSVACIYLHKTAKSLVAAGLARRCLVQLSYAIGVSEPLSIFVDTYGTGKKTNEELVEIIRHNWDLRPGVMGR